MADDNSDFEGLKSRFRRLAELRQTRDIDKKTAEMSEVEYREYEAEVLAAIEDSSLKGSIEFDFDELGAYRFTKRATTYGRVTDMNLALDYFDDNAITDEMTAPKVESKRLNEFVRDAVENGRDLPEGIGSYERKFITITRKQQ
jgi:hypothetical protein